MTLQTLQEIIVSFGLDRSKLQGSAKLYEEIGLDSSEVALLSTEISKRLGVSIPFKLSKDWTLDELAAEIDRKKA